jgi:hypothetical protein
VTLNDWPRIEDPSSFSPAGSLANLTALQESVKRLVMIVTSGTNAPGSQASFDLDGPSLKTCRDYYRQREGHSLPKSSVTWPRWGIAWTGGFGALTTLGQFTAATGSSSSPTWQTPVADDCAERVAGKWNSRGDPKLSAQVKMWPTPDTRGFTNVGSLNMLASVTANREEWEMMAYRTGSAQRQLLWPTPAAQDAKNATLPQSQQDRDTVPGALIRDGTTGALNPDWVTWMMGFPDGWLDLPEPAGSRSRKSSESHQE